MSLQRRQFPLLSSPSAFLKGYFPKFLPVGALSSAVRDASERLVFEFFGSFTCVKIVCGTVKKITETMVTANI